MERYKVEVVAPRITKMGESPYWDYRRSVLRFVDIPAGIILDFDPETQSIQKRDVDGVIGSVNPAGKDHCIAALSNGLYLYNLNTMESRVLCPRDKEVPPSTRYNDSKCDAKGRLWVGTTDMERNKICSLYCFTDHLEEKAGDLIISNGLAWSPDQKTMYHIDTWVRHLWRYEFDLEEGKITNARLVFSIPEDLVYPDGMTIDEEGKLWIAFWGGSRVCRFDPETGVQLAEIMLPVKNPTCCTFGGENLDELYITSAVGDDTSELAGSLFRVKLPYHGMLPYDFDVAYCN